MRRNELEHLIRAAAAVTNQYEIVTVGSQSILGAVPTPPLSLAESMEADVYPYQRPDLADLIDGSIGEGSPFHDCFVKVGLCLEPHDLADSKLAAGREKDWIFVAGMIQHNIVDT